MKKITLLIALIPLFCISQTINKSMFFDGIDREYIVYVPANYDGSKDVPIMFNFHGGAGFASDFILANDMRPIADTAGFIAVYPQGAFDYEGAEDGNAPSTSWLHKAPTTHNDVNFIAAIIDTLSTEYLIDADRVYACGYSEGGIFSYELGCRLNDRIASFVSVSGSMMVDSFREEYYGLGLCNPIHPTAIMLIPGTQDESFHSTYDGFQPYYMSVDEITSYWSGYNNTDENPMIESVANTNPTDGSTVERKTWSNGENCVSVVELKVNGGGHDWPGVFGNMDISATNEIWNFVSKYNRQGLIDCETVSLKETIANANRELVKIINILGQEVKFRNIKNGEILFKIYDDGSVEKCVK